ncbi:MAG: thiamine-phosphate kinase [Bacteroidales bacterium]|jgi:thiamine-monophosphate kinase
MASKKETNDLEEIGEFGLIRLLTEKIELKNPSSLTGVGDDAAVLDTKGRQIVVTTDLLAEGIHFDLVYSPLKHLGYKAVVVNLSDVYAMNARPAQVLVSVALSAKFSTEMMKELYEGIHLACKTYHVDLVGGDTSSSMTGLTISVTAIGLADKDGIVYRSGAKVNELICVSGDLGGAYMGLQILEREKMIYGKESTLQPDLSGYEYILERQLKPEARADIVTVLKENNIRPTSMIDVSDGLSSDLLHLCDASDTGCKIFADKIPIAGETIKAAEELNLEPVTTSIHGGEDYELLFTLPAKDFERLSSVRGISVIGHMTDKKEGKHLVMSDGSYTEIHSMGWNSLKNKV